MSLTPLPSISRRGRPCKRHKWSHFLAGYPDRVYVQEGVSSPGNINKSTSIISESITDCLPEEVVPLSSDPSCALQVLHLLPPVRNRVRRILYVC